MQKSQWARQFTQVNKWESLTNQVIEVKQSIQKQLHCNKASNSFESGGIVTNWLDNWPNNWLTQAQI